MNTKAEILDVLDGHYKGQLPPPVILTQTGTVGMMDACGAHWPEANFDTDKMVRLSLQPHELFGLATARVPYDVVLQAEAVGCSIEPGTVNRQPSVSGSPWRTDDMGMPPFPEDLVSPDEMLAHPHIRTVIDAAERLHSRDDLFVTSMCIAGGGMVMHMLGMENMLMSMMFNESDVMHWIRRMSGYSAAYARELSKVSDNVCVITDVMSNIMSPQTASRMAAEDRAVVQAIKDSYSMVHNCGDTLANVEDIVSMGSDILSLEMSPKPVEYMMRIRRRCKILGAINPVLTMLEAGPDDVLREARASARMGVDLVGPECGLPPMTPNENVAALARYRGV